MIFPIPKKETYSDGRYAVSSSLASLSLVDLFAAVKEGKAGIAVSVDSALAGEAHKISIGDSGVKITYATEEGLFRAVTSLWQLMRKNGENLPYAEIEDAPTLERRGYMLDISRGRMPKLEEYLSIADMLAALKYNEFQIYMEGHVFKYSEFPQYTADFDCLTPEEVCIIDAYCRERFIDLVPNQNSFGHLYQWLKNDELSHLAVAPEGGKGGTINPLLPESLEFIDKLYASLLPHHTSGYVNVGFDEAYGLGKYQMEEYCNKIGKANVFMEWLGKVADLALNKYGKRVQFWSDMIYNYPETYPKIPKGAVALEWGYDLIQSQQMAEHCIDYQRQGIDYYVCPSCNTHLSFTGRNDVTTFNIRTAAEVGQKYGAKGILLTDWGCGCGQPTFLVWSAFPIALTAQYGWNVGARQDGSSFKYDYIKAAEQYVDETVFEKSGVAELLFRFSNYYLLEPDRIHCGTMCGDLFQVPLSGTTFNGIFELKNRPYTFYFENVRDYMKKILDEFMQLDIDPQLKGEIAVNARSVIVSAELCRLRLGEKLSDEELLALIAMLDGIREEFTDLWLRRNHENGIEIFLSQISGRREELTALLSKA